MLNLHEVEGILEKMKLRLLIQEKSEATGADVLDSPVLLRDGHLLILLLLEKRPGKRYFTEVKWPNLEFWFIWKDGDKVYVQKVGDEEIIPLEVGEVDAFIDLMLH
ncbi:hypothetical protein P8X34_08875 [Pyrococcus kukulkanii]|uniref:Uncharacterized protein n=2 Tax=Pyrococcus kukulkanii TaxID=1609559 RepID=A0ABV4T823_9EURY